VEPGTYGPINFKGKAITVKSSSGPSLTTITGSPGVTFNMNEEHDSIIKGFKITKSSPGILCEYSSPTIEDNIIHQNWAGICCEYSFPLVKNNIISENSYNHAYDCGGMANYESSPTVIGCTFIANTNKDSGGGMANLHHSSPIVTDCTFSENTVYGAYRDGGGMYCWWYSNPIITNCTFNANSAANQSGGIHYWGGGTITVTGCDFFGNSAKTGGGMFNGDDATITNCSFTGNISDGAGGGIDNRGSLDATNCILFENEAGSGGGGITNSTFSDATLTNCTLVYNWANTSGGGLSCGWECHVTVINTIFWDNHAPTGPQISVGGSATYPASLTISYSDLDGGHSAINLGPHSTLNWGAGMIDEDPLFLDPLDHELHISFASPCIDAGDNKAPMLPATDFEGDPRIFIANGKGGLIKSPPPSGAIVDMGADEHCLLKKQMFNSR
jgi:parallel beta-helix repeat protein